MLNIWLCPAVLRVVSVIGVKGATQEARAVKKVDHTCLVNPITD